MLKTILLSAAALALTGASPAGSTPASGSIQGLKQTRVMTDGWEQCLIRSGCFFQESTMTWVCPDDSIYMLCDAPPGDPPA